MRITILYGSYREPRLGIRAVKLLEANLSKRGHEVEIVDAKAYDLPVIDKRYVDYPKGEKPEKLQYLKTLFEDKTDLFLIVAGEYNSTMQPGLTNLMNYFYKEYAHKPCGVVTYSVGALGGARVSMHLSTLIYMFGMCPIPGVFGIGNIEQHLDEAGQQLTGTLKNQLSGFTARLEWYGEMFIAARQKGLPS